ncbi:MAG: N-acetylglucosamine-specific PTS transporter subunit IIBC [Lachnospiraceae bacterium]
MMNTMQRLGKSLMLPVACLPVAAILMGIGYWIDPAVMTANTDNVNVISAFLVKSGDAIISHMGILFALGVAIGMSTDGEGTSALAGLVSWLMVTNLLKPESVAMFLKIAVEDVNPAFGQIENQFVGIICGLIGAFCYNKFKNTKLPDALSFFSGKRCVSIVTAGITTVVTLILFVIWPIVYGALITFGEFILGLGPIGAGIYGFLNRLLIPLGLHHALNSVFWFDIAGINDIAKFWGTIEGGVLGQTGMYLTGFFAVMMFGIPAAALAMYHTAKKERKQEVKGLYGSGALSAVFTGITEPIEFSFMFLAPGLYFVHAILSGITIGICAALPVRSGFNFSGGFVDWFLSFKAPMALNPLLVIPIGLIVGTVYYIVFRFAIIKFNIKTPGREDAVTSIGKKSGAAAAGDYDSAASVILEGLGGKENIAILDNCITRLRIEVKDLSVVDDNKIKSSGITSGIMRPGKNSIQIIVGTKVQFAADAMKKLL